MTAQRRSPTAGGAAPDPAEHVRLLARVVDRTGRKVTALDQHVSQLAADVARVAALVAHDHTLDAPTPPGSGADTTDSAPDAIVGGNGESGGSPTAPPSLAWLLAADPEQAVADLADLIGWLDRVYVRYPDGALTACWLWHPHVIEELRCLRRVHAEVYDPETGSWQRAADWHDRQRPGVARRITQAIGTCDLTLHAPGQSHGQPPLPAPLASFAAQIAALWAVERSCPEPDPTQLSDAVIYQRALHRSHR